MISNICSSFPSKSQCRSHTHRVYIYTALIDLSASCLLLTANPLAASRLGHRWCEMSASKVNVEDEDTRIIWTAHTHVLIQTLFVSLSLSFTHTERQIHKTFFFSFTHTHTHKNIYFSVFTQILPIQYPSYQVFCNEDRERPDLVGQVLAYRDAHRTGSEPTAVFCWRVCRLRPRGHRDKFTSAV